jgi:ABC-2 type transport system ATP-binding protein
MTDAMTTRHLTKYYGSRCVVNSLDLHVPHGCVYGLLGRNGAGKSTAIKMLMGMVQPSYGEAEILDFPLGAAPPDVRQRIAYIAENHPHYNWMTVREAAAFAAAFYPRWNDRLLTQILDHFELPRRAKLRRLHCATPSGGGTPRSRTIVRGASPRPSLCL